MTKDLTRLSLTEARQGLLDKSFSSRELTSAHIKAMEQQRSNNAFITETTETALTAADQADKNLQKGQGKLLEGLPIAIKDLFCTEGVLTTAGSNILNNFVPTYESTVTSQLWCDGAICLGKTNLDEFGMGSANTHSHFGPVKNPWHRSDTPKKSLVPGGSSGGSAAAVAGYYATAATGTDTGGSIRQPASFCGIVGLKPTYGRCSRWGIVAFASSLDQAGPMTRTVRDSALMLQSMAGHDAKDSTSANIAVPDYLAAITGKIEGMKVGVPAEYSIEGTPPEIEALWQQGITWLRQAGAEIIDVNLEHTSYALPAYYIIAPAEASSNLARYDGVRYGLRIDSDSLDDMYEKTRGAGFGHEVKRRILIGAYALSAGYYDAYYVKAQKVRALIAQDFDKAFDEVDVLLTPTTPNEAFGLEDKMSDPVMMYLNDIFTVPASLAGLPAISVPSGLSSHGLPLGLQLIGRRFDEATILNAASILEQAAGFKLDPYGDKTNDNNSGRK